MPNYCPDCGLDNEPNSRFCNGCGANLAKGATRKVELLDNRYQVMQVIKEGGMGCVYKAMDTRLGEVVAIKSLSEKSASSECDNCTCQA